MPNIFFINTKRLFMRVERTLKKVLHPGLTVLKTNFYVKHFLLAQQGCILRVERTSKKVLHRGLTVLKESF